MQPIYFPHKFMIENDSEKIATLVYISEAALQAHPQLAQRLDERIAIIAANLRESAEAVYESLLFITSDLSGVPFVGCGIQLSDLDDEGNEIQIDPLPVHYLYAAEYDLDFEYLLEYIHIVDQEEHDSGRCVISQNRYYEITPETREHIKNCQLFYQDSERVLDFLDKASQRTTLPDPAERLLTGLRKRVNINDEQYLDLAAAEERVLWLNWDGQDLEGPAHIDVKTINTDEGDELPPLEDFL
ncbi:hypothetical protein MASR2M15_12610 [Anaerolineales bacterium]